MQLRLRTNIYLEPLNGVQKTADNFVLLRPVVSSRAWVDAWTGGGGLAPRLLEGGFCVVSPFFLGIKIKIVATRCQI